MFVLFGSSFFQCDVDVFQSPINQVSQVWDITMNMLGTEDSPSFKGKAAEVHGLVKFVKQMFEKYSSRFAAVSADIKFQSEALLEASKAALKFDEILLSRQCAMTDTDIDMLMQHYLHFATLYERAGGNLTQKFHLMCHGIQNSSYFGNLNLHTTYKSESFNGVLARIAAQCHKRNWYSDLFWRVSLLNKTFITKQMH